MGEKVNPWCHCPNSAWQFGIQSAASNLRPPAPDIVLENTNSMVLPTYPNSNGYISTGIAASAPIFVRTLADESILKTSRSVATPTPRTGLSGIDAAQKRFLIFNRNGIATCPIVGARLISRGTLDPVAELQGSNETNVTDVVHGEEMHEDTEEIDALLDSDTEEVHEEGHGEPLTGRCPVEMDTWSTESVASAGDASVGAACPTKKRKLSSDLDISIVDTASSARANHSMNQKLRVDDDAESCCIGEVESDEKAVSNEGEEGGDDSPDDRKRRRERIRETVAALRKIVPGGIGKDAATVLDEAICYLKYLKLKAKSLGAISL